MKNQRQFYRCAICGNLIGMIEASGVTPFCCGQEMNELVPNTTDAAQEKHVPVGVREGNTLTVKVGSAPHPMTQEHHISWIAIAEGDHTQRMRLDPTGVPEAKFVVGDQPITLYAYCNLHGLWAAEVQ